MAADNGDETGEAFIEKEPVTQVFGLHPRARIVAAMLSQHDDELAAFTESELRRITGVDETECAEAIRALSDRDLVVEADESEVPEGPAYRFNHDTQAVEAIMSLNDELIDHLQS